MAAPAARGAYRYCSIAVLAVSLLFSGPPNAAADDVQAELAQINSPKPAFSLDNLNRQTVSLADQHSDIVLVHFFATWCEPCREELPALNRLVARSDRAQLRVVTISVAEGDIRVRNFAEKLPVDFPILLDRDRSVAKSWNVSALPTTFILDRNLRPRLFVERDYDWDRLDVAQLQKSFGE